MALDFLSLILAPQSDQEQVTKEKKIETVPRIVSQDNNTTSVRFVPASGLFIFQ